MSLAAIYAALDCSLLIRVPHLHAALAVWDYAVQSVAYIFGDSLGDPVADEILRALRQHSNGMTRNELRDHFGRNRSSEVIGRALGTLAGMNLARCENEDTGGRPAERWYAVTRKGGA